MAQPGKKPRGCHPIAGSSGQDRRADMRALRLEQRALDLVSRQTLAQRIGQLVGDQKGAAVLAVNRIGRIVAPEDLSIL
ncbi:MAG: hypothetical protein IPF96_15650 [Rhodobacter sp.]|nr:hypothetical protein [Rhodobacter sp.]